MIIRTSKAKATMLFIGCLAATWACHHFANGGADWITGRSAGKLQFGFYIFAIITFFAFFKMLASGQTIAKIDSSGLLVPHVSNSVIPWGDIADMAVVTKAGNESIVFNINQASASAQRVKSKASVTKAVGSAVNVNGHVINLAMTGISAEDFGRSVAAAIEKGLNTAPLMRQPPTSQKSTAQPQHQAMPRFGKRNGI